MSVARMADADKLDELHMTILGELSEGRGTPSFIGKRVGESRQLVSNRLHDLIMADLAEKVDTGLYEITDKGRDALDD